MKFLINEKKWPTPGSVPFLEVLEQISDEIDISNVNTFIECGSGENGDNAYHFSTFFDVISIEINDELFKRYCNRKGKNHNIEWILGDGVDNLKKILEKKPEERFVILLDDHTSYNSFIRQELLVIEAYSKVKDHIIIIDDMTLEGKGTYPTVKEVHVLCKKINPEYTIKNTKIGHNIHVVYTNREKK